MPPKFLTSSRTDVGKTRRRNEDCVLASSIGNAAILAVADGMGGAHGGDVCSRTVIDSVYGDLSQRQIHPSAGDDDSGWIDAMRDAFEHSMEALQQRAAQDDALSEMGTTLTCLVITDTSVSFAHLGDSRAYLFRNGDLRRLTTDHNKAQELVDEGRISAAEAMTHPSRNVLTRWISAASWGFVPEVGSFKTQKNDVYVLCTDGLHALVPQNELEEALRSLVLDQAGLDNLSAKLVDRANERGGPDNISVVIGVYFG
jgi:protein phosphatase